MRTSILIGSLLLALSPLCQAASIYKWVDAQGVTHFDAQPPPGQPVSVVTPTIAPPAPPRSQVPASSPVGDQRAVDAKVKKRLAERDAMLKVFCDKARTNLARLQNDPRVREEVNGEPRRLTEEERQTRLIETRKAIEENCS
ncbi:DUF4124 domain-containing protein [Pseudomonas agarici]|uniref:DUF4124 domain-containing protein n=1 Tax=Pseudomonas agarici TaxID=46677 RepID=UPI0002D5802B|nr:DUF4124 domain-containing protein [Pseudomonas agarici]NWB94157.1 DUF4124 domain-containing protein [Pseudomonas agarici]NWC11608.1 DUF4124 domain-containing protein [Pseudomonas agarici]SEL79168.1 protein of unknown function [Pseudomonas agarici]